jgi:hypothetical protein
LSGLEDRKVIILSQKNQLKPANKNKLTKKIYLLFISCLLNRLILSSLSVIEISLPVELE